MKSPLYRIFLLLFSFFLLHCQTSQPKETFAFKKPAVASERKASESITLANKGVGPITMVDLSQQIDTAMVKNGAAIYSQKCTACHRIGKTFIGPPPNGILQRRSPEWVMNLLLNTEEMLKEDSTAKALFMEFNGQLMTNQNLTQTEARDVLEYFRTLD